MTLPPMARIMFVGRTEVSKPLLETLEVLQGLLQKLRQLVLVVAHDCSPPLRVEVIAGAIQSTSRVK
jgi:hypothetical protein